MNERYGVVQFRFLRGSDYAYRVQPVDGVEKRESYVSQTLSIIGTDEQDRGPQMEAGFMNEYSNGGRIIRSVPIDEVAGTDESTRSNARWGVTQAITDPPPADERGARTLLGVVDRGVYEFPLACDGDLRAQVCTIAPERRAEIEPLWWRALAEDRLERLNFYALRRCYDSTWTGGGSCDAVPDSDEPDYKHRP
ncbi:hypothetical protein [Tianweitania sp.]|uniref:hypothetical protein n=1 Tax=Tianweitania sp. TaxID=2021634 RepID=UPI002896F5DB|nr:hypothetical protein [Tianweitania sp.]